jgi:hypothetical protein
MTLHTLDQAAPTTVERTRRRPLLALGLALA